jgi:methylmalonyl-CoA/ethylmalonyl-CoA epimerase
MIVRIDHVGVIARAWDEAAEVLLKKMGFDLDEGRTKVPGGNYFAPENTDIYFVKVGLGETRVEVLLPRDNKSGIGRRLEKYGAGLHHIGYGSTDPQADAAVFRERGMKQIDLTSGGRGDLPGSATPFFYPQSAGGILTEIVPARDD